MCVSRTFALDAVASLEQPRSLLRLLGLAGMARGGWGCDVAGDKVEDGPQAVEDIVLAGELTGVLEGEVGPWAEGMRRSAGERDANSKRRDGGGGVP